MQAEKRTSISSSSSSISKVLVSTCMILILCLSTFDWFGIEGIVPLLQQHYGIKDAETAMIRTTSSMSQTVLFVLIWIFGDSFKRRRLYLASVAAWIACSLLSLFLGSGTFMIFVIFRSLGAAASAVFGVLSPVIMADIFKDRALGVALMSLSIGEMATSSLAEIGSSWVVASGMPWQTGLLGSTLLAILPMIFLVCAKRYIRNVARTSKGIRGFFSGAFGVFSIKSYVLLALAGAFDKFHKKAFTFWFPSVFLIVWTNNPEQFFGLSYTTTTVLRSSLQLVGIVTGLPIFLWLAQSRRYGTGLFTGSKEYPRAYPIVVSVGSVLSGSMFILSILLADTSYIGHLVTTFLTGFGGAADGALGQQMMLMVVPSTSRAAAVALSRLITGVVTIPSAQLVGTIADVFRGDSTSPFDQFRGYQLGLLCSSSFLVASSLCNVALVFAFSRDCEKVKEIGEDEIAVSDETTALIKKTNQSKVIE